MITQKQIARQLGLSQSAVACAFHPNLHSHLSQMQRDRIRTTAAQLGYEPHRGARRLVRRRFQRPSRQFDQVGLIYFAGSDMPLDTVCLAMIYGAEHEVARSEATFVVVNAGTPKGWQTIDRMARTGAVDGWLVYGAVDDEIVSRLRRHAQPFVILGDHECQQPVNSVRIDNAAAADLAVRHLAAHGHHRISYLRVGSKEFIYQKNTFAGFVAAIDALGLEKHERLMVPQVAWGGLDGTRLLDYLSNNGSISLPTALFASEPGAARGICRYLQSAGLSVPGGMSVIGCEYDVFDGAAVEATSVVLPVSDVGRQGASWLHKLVVDGDGEPREIKILPKLIDKQSVGSPPAARIAT